MGWYDHINERKIHSGDIPRLGGLGFAISFLVFAVIVKFQSPEPQRTVFLAPAFALILISGVRDDFKPMSPRFKMVLHISAALCAVAAGYVFKRAFYSGSVDFLNFPGWSPLRYPLTVLWIVGMTNAINFIDGVDGLAGGVCLLAALSFGGIFSFLGADGGISLLCFCLASAILGFLVLNAPFPKARIFMGDGGAYFLGFTLALFPVSADRAANLPVPYAAAILLIPILDTVAAVWRRLRDRRPIDSPDRAHTHHKLMNLGLSSRGIDAVLFALQISLGLLVFAAIKAGGGVSLLFLSLAYGAALGFFIAVHFLNRHRQKIITKKSGSPGTPNGPAVLL
ncbi:MAG: undecaprenyl/decaprenyl-phosphate alpha-N-acetylglucosaminyl 1-phosphate transferase [Treponema sp.]|nr:undecaprenyl/decaprenyl-phosphate alpha-N-acetylglucosaminyl 1-phosphate transferase [Treponema sp.]